MNIVVPDCTLFKLSKFSFCFKENIILQFVTAEEMISFYILLNVLIHILFTMLIIYFVLFLCTAIQNYRTLLGVEPPSQSGFSDLEDDLEEQVAAMVDEPK